MTILHPVTLLLPLSSRFPVEAQVAAQFSNAFSGLVTHAFSSGLRKCWHVHGQVDFEMRKMRMCGPYFIWMKDIVSFLQRRGYSTTTPLSLAKFICSNKTRASLWFHVFMRFLIEIITWRPFCQGIHQKSKAFIHLP